MPVAVYGCALFSHQHSTLQALTIEHTCWSLLQRHQTPCRHTRLTPRIPTGGPAWLLLTHTVACGERHFPDRCTHILKHIHSHSAPHSSTTETQTHYDQQALYLRIIEIFSLCCLSIRTSFQSHKRHHNSMSPVYVCDCV